jgi:hypothetical protein
MFQGGFAGQVSSHTCIPTRIRIRTCVLQECTVSTSTDGKEFEDASTVHADDSNELQIRLRDATLAVLAPNITSFSTASISPIESADMCGYISRAALTSMAGSPCTDWSYMALDRASASRVQMEGTRDVRPTLALLWKKEYRVFMYRKSANHTHARTNAREDLNNKRRGTQNPPRYIKYQVGTAEPQQASAFK